jgi:AraC-like DNA-binding protein
MLEPSIRRIIDGATNGAFLKVHVESLPDAVRAVREHSATALLLSPSIARRHGLSAISGLVAKAPGVTAVAVLGEDWATSHSALLDLGACGVREVVNLAQHEGWNRLRSIVDQHGGECGRVIAREILVTMDDASDDARQFVATVVRLAPVTTTVRVLAGVIGIDPSTLMSRFFRASLPAPKRYLSMTRLLYAAWFLGMPKVSVAATADALHYSSPQSFGRHVRTTLGLTAAEFRRELPMKAALEHYRARLIEPYREILKSFRPLAPT